MPLILEMEFEDGSTESRFIPAEIWRRNNEKVSKLVITSKPLKQIQIDPRGQTADASDENNFFPRRIESRQIELSPSSRRRGGGGGQNPLRKALGLDKKDKDKDSDKQKEKSSDES